MRPGIQTIQWGQRPDVISMVTAIAGLGYKGVEVAQRPEALGPRDDFLRLLDDHCLDLVGLAGGTLEERMTFCGKDLRAPYLYVDEWTSGIADQATAEGFTLALHPHVYAPTDCAAKAEQTLAAHSELLFILDTAHLTIAGDDILQVLEDTSTQLASVHLKDWSPAFGRSPMRYAKGFRPLGEGVIDLDAMMVALGRAGYEGWLLTEQDWSSDPDPQVSAWANATWLVARGVDMDVPDDPIDTSVQRAAPIRAERTECHYPADLAFVRAASRASTYTPDLFYAEIAGAFRDVIPGALVTVWSHCPTQQLLILVGVSSRSPRRFATCAVPIGGTHMQRALASRAVTSLDRLAEDRYFVPEVTECMDDCGDHVVAVPILNPYNMHQVRAIVNVFPGHRLSAAQNGRLQLLAEDVARELDRALSEMCLGVSSDMVLLARGCRSSGELASALAQRLRDVLCCEGVSVFLTNDSSERLLPAGSTGLRWSTPGHYYIPGEGLTGSAWAQDETLLTEDASRLAGVWKGKSSEAREGSVTHQVLAAPIRGTTEGTNDVVGIIRCANKLPDERLASQSMFSHDDIDIVESVAESVAPYLELVMHHERRARSVSRLVHELQVPLVAMRGATQFVQRTAGVADLLDEDYLTDMVGWYELMTRLIGNAAALGVQFEALPIKPRATSLLRDVIAPAVRHAGLLVRERQFDPANITWDMADFPKLFADRGLMQQVFFNLLSNAVKYAHDDPAAFHVEICWSREGQALVVVVSDWGTGIEEASAHRVFEEGFRTLRANQLSVSGQGLGLWVCRQVVARHGGTIEVSNCALPTEITFRLPAALQWQVPT